jgi:hypothetical protein
MLFFYWVFLTLFTFMLLMFTARCQFDRPRPHGCRLGSGAGHGRTYTMIREAQTGIEPNSASGTIRYLHLRSWAEVLRNEVSKASCLSRMYVLDGGLPVFLRGVSPHINRVHRLTWNGAGQESHSLRGYPSLTLILSPFPSLFPPPTAAAQSHSWWP